MTRCRAVTLMPGGAKVLRTDGSTCARARGGPGLQWEGLAARQCTAHTRHGEPALAVMLRAQVVVADLFVTEVQRWRRSSRAAREMRRVKLPRFVFASGVLHRQLWQTTVEVCRDALIVVRHALVQHCSRVGGDLAAHIAARYSQMIEGTFSGTSSLPRIAVFLARCFR